MNKFPFVSDLVLVVARSEKPSIELLREVAEQLDFVVLFPAAFQEYVGAVRQRLAPWHAKFGVDPSGRPKPLEEFPHLAVRDDAFFGEAAQQPFGSRSNEWLESNRVHLLALNLPALDELQERVLEDMPHRWVELFGDERWMRKFGMPPLESVEYTLASEIGQVEADGLLAGQARGQEKNVEATGIHTSHSFSLSDVTLINGADNLPSDEGTLHIERAGRSLKVRTAGLVFVGPGCELTLRWMKEDGRTLNGPNAQKTSQDRDEVIELRGEDEALAGQWLEFQFRRSTGRTYALSGRIEL